jgi:predicted permease
VIIVESSMPTAVNAVVYATEFKCGPKLVAVGILAATLGSMLSVTLVLEYLL